MSGTRERSSAATRHDDSGRYRAVKIATTITTPSSLTRPRSIGEQHPLGQQTGRFNNTESIDGAEGRLNWKRQLVAQSIDFWENEDEFDAFSKQKFHLEEAALLNGKHDIHRRPTWNGAVGGRPNRVRNSKQAPNGEAAHRFRKSTYLTVSGRTNVILLGDNMIDIHMDVGVEKQDPTLKIFFLKSDIFNLLSHYLEVYDIVLVQERSMQVPNAIIEIITSGGICRK
ncbi:hypothetical protein Q1695_011144 [Nippostrongylus brasiliensis]|nr:hypothetical protein Q1695_011144 [Nippostrongylus brasiliensis]